MVRDPHHKHHNKVLLFGLERNELIKDPLHMGVKLLIAQDMVELVVPLDELDPKPVVGAEDLPVVGRILQQDLEIGSFKVADSGVVIPPGPCVRVFLVGLAPALQEFLRAIEVLPEVHGAVDVKLGGEVLALQQLEGLEDVIGGMVPAQVGSKLLVHLEVVKL